MPESSFLEYTEAMVAVFYREGTEPHREQLALAREEAAALDALREASCIEDEALLARLAALGIRAETLAALTLIPLIEVAWADGVMENKEREAVLAAAESSGIAAGSPSHGLLRIWTEERPPPDLVLAWRDFIRALGPQLNAEQREKLGENVVGRARSVAEAAGGFLGIGSISKPERDALDALSEAFEA
jgi:hypothetical protein